MFEKEFSRDEDFVEKLIFMIHMNITSKIALLDCSIILNCLFILFPHLNIFLSSSRLFKDLFIIHTRENICSPKN